MKCPISLIVMFSSVLLAGCFKPTEPAPPPLAAPGPCVSQLELAIQKELPLAKGKPAVRSGIANVSLPATSEEYERMNKTAIIAIALFSNREGDLPATRLHLVPDSKDKLLSLPSIFPKWHVTKLPKDHPQAVLGKYKQESFFFVPIHYLTRPGDIGVPFTKDSKGVPLLRLPLRIQTDFIAKDPHPEEDPKRPPDPDTTFSILASQYCWGL